MDRKIAEQIVALANAHIDQLIASLGPVQQQVSREDFASYQRGVARVIAAYETEIIDRVAHEHPDLKPADEDADAQAAEPAPARPTRN